MKAQLFLIGIVAALSLSALTLADAVQVGSASPGRQNPSPSPFFSPSPSPSESPSTEPSDQPSSDPSASPSAHPCNYGFYVSQAAHGKHGGAFTSQIARSNLGKNGDCSRPLPSPSDGASAGRQGSDKSGAEGDSPGSGTETEQESDSD
jgi:hypothetical protein